MVIGDIVKGVFGDKGLAVGVIDALKAAGVITDPEQALKAQAALQDYELNVGKEINSTMRAEAASEHWAQWLWRPIVGFTFAGVIINNYILIPYSKAFGLNIQIIDIPSGIWEAMLVVLGVAAGTRGLEKWQREKK